MEDRTHELETRLTRLEQDNRRLRLHLRAAAAGALALGSLGLVAMAAPRLCNTVTAERFVLEDEHGRTRMLLDAYGQERPSLVFRNAQGRDVARLEVGADAVDLSVFREGAATPARLRLAPQEGGAEPGVD